MQYRIRDKEVIHTAETSGTIQNASNIAAEISTSADFSDVFVLRGWDRITFTSPLYIRAREEKSPLIILNVLQDFFLSKNNGGSGESLSTEDKAAIAQSFKSAKTEGNTVSFFTDSDTTGTPAFSFNFPEEIFLDQVGTRLVENFSWSALAYPNSVNPNLEGKAVLVLAVKGDKETNPTVKYSFVNLEKLVDVYTAADNSITISDHAVAVKVSATADNSLTLKVDGLHVDISGKVDKVAGKDLSTNDYTTAEKTKLAGVENNAQVNVIETVKVDGTALTTSSKAVNIDLSGKVDKVAGAQSGNFAFFDSVGGLVDKQINLEQLVRPVRYGYKIKKTEPDPYARVEYIYDAVGFTPAYMNFASDEFNYGSWANVWFVKDNKPLMLKNDGTVDYYLYENDYTYKAVGTDVTVAGSETSDVSNAEYEGNAMVQIPLCWVCRYEDSDYIYEIVSNVQWDENYKAYAHTNASGQIKQYFYYGMFDGSGDASSIRSLANQTVSKNLPTASQIQGAVANGSGWYIHSWSQRELIRTLCVLLGKSTDTQTVFGLGRTTEGGRNDTTIGTGTLTNKGQFYGSSANTSAVKVFHIENFWGNQWDRTAGFIMNYSDGYVYVKMTPEGDGYRITDVTGMTKTTVLHNFQGAQFISSCTAAVEGGDDFGVIPAETTNGSSSTYYCDILYTRASSAYPGGGIGYLQSGCGSESQRTWAGAFALGDCWAPSHTSYDIGCGLSYIG